MTKPHLLMTAWAFAPARTSGVYRAIGIANTFAAQGWDVTVLTASEETFSVEGATDVSLLAHVRSDIEVVRVPFASGVYSADVVRWSAARARHPELWSMTHGCAFPEIGFGDWRPILTRAAERQHVSRPVDLTLGTASPSVDFIPGWRLKRRFGVPYILDYRDAWTIDVFTGARSARTTGRAERWERRLVAAADQIWFVNEPIRGWHAAKYPSAAGRMRVVPNGFDLIEGVSPAVKWRPLAPDKPLTFGYIGTINQGQFPAEQLLAGWQRARELSPAMRSARMILRGHLGRTGVAGEKLSAFLERAAAVGIRYEGPVAKAEVASIYAEFDALVLALASGPGVTSGKVFEFAATGLPVVSVHEPDSAASAVMSGSPVWTPSASMHPDDIAAAFLSTVERVRQQTPASRASAIAWGAQWERGRQLESGVVGARALLGYDRQVSQPVREDL